MLLRSIFGKRLRDARGGLLGWGLAIVALVALTVFSYPAVRDLPELNRLIEELPEAVRALIGENDILSPAGYLNARLFTLLVPLIIAIYAITAGAGAVAGEEERGRLDLLLANPVPRWRVALGSFAALLVVLVLFGLLTALTILLGVPLVDLEVEFANVTAAAIHATAFGVLFGGLALGIGAATGSRTAALGITAVVALATYLIHALAPLVDALAPLDEISPFGWYLRGDPLRNGMAAGDVGLLLLGGLLAVVLGTLRFERRDIAT